MSYFWENYWSLEWLFLVGECCRDCMGEIGVLEGGAWKEVWKWVRGISGGRGIGGFIKGKMIDGFYD